MRRRSEEDEKRTSLVREKLERNLDERRFVWSVGVQSWTRCSGRKTLPRGSVCFCENRDKRASKARATPQHRMASVLL